MDKLRCKKCGEDLSHADYYIESAVCENYCCECVETMPTNVLLDLLNVPIYSAPEE